MLTIPSYKSWPFDLAFAAPGHALFLTGVEYEVPGTEDVTETLEEKLAESKCECIQVKN